MAQRIWHDYWKLYTYPNLLSPIIVTPVLLLIFIGEYDVFIRIEIKVFLWNNIVESTNNWLYVMYEL